MMLADMTAWDFLSTNWGSVAILLTAVGGGITAFAGAIGYGIHVAWTFVSDKLNLLVTDHRELVSTLKAQIPKQTETLGTLSELVQESRDRGRDIVREVANTKAAAGEISYAMEAMAEAKPDDVKRYMSRARQRLGIEKKPARDSD